MGLEADCEARIGRGRWQPGRAQLEEKELVFRGEARLRAPLAQLSDVRAEGGLLRCSYDGQDLALRLGDQAPRWADRILNPPSRLDKLGVKPGLAVAVIGLDDPAFVDELKARGAVVKPAAKAAGLDIVFYGCRAAIELARLEALARAIRPEGAIWVLWPKGGKQVREQDVRDAAAGPGLVDVKVVSFSPELSGLKLMIRRELRPPAPARARR